MRDKLRARWAFSHMVQGWHVTAASCAAAALLAMTSFNPSNALAQVRDDAQAPRGSQSAGGGDGGLSKRVSALEEQLIDLQVVIGTLESLARQGGNSTASSGPAFRAGSGSAAADTSRIESLEMQVRALTAQIEQLSNQVRSLGGNPGAAPQAGYPVDPGGATSAFGSTTVTPDGGDAIGGMIGGNQPPPGSFGSQTLPPSGPPASANASDLPPIDTANPKQLYETAYGYLLQRDYGAAEVAFDDFLKKYPSDSLAGNAQYWLGESYFVRGQYKAAASAFLKGYQTYAANAKAPDSLLKLGMSLDRLGQKDAACSSYNELHSRFPNAPQSVKSRVQSERQRVGCS